MSTPMAPEPDTAAGRDDLRPTSDEGSVPAQSAPPPLPAAEAFDVDHDVRRGVVDRGVARRDQTEHMRSGHEVTLGTGVGGTYMGTAGSHSAAGTAATSDLDRRRDLSLSRDEEENSSLDEVFGRRIDVPDSERRRRGR